MNTRSVLVLFFTLLALPAHAYIGPGVGAGAIAVVLGVVVAVGMAFVAILWYPIKRLLKNRKTKSEPVSDDEPAEK